MNLEMIVRTIQLIIAPAVMITACCIFTNGLLGHYAAIGERLRITVRERVDLLRLREKEVANISGMVATGRLADIDFQVPSLLRHHLLVRNALAVRSLP